MDRYFIWHMAGPLRYFRNWINRMLNGTAVYRANCFSTSNFDWKCIRYWTVCAYVCACLSACPPSPFHVRLIDSFPLYGMVCQPHRAVLFADNGTQHSAWVKRIRWLRIAYIPFSFAQACATAVVKINLLLLKARPRAMWFCCVWSILPAFKNLDVLDLFSNCKETKITYNSSLNYTGYFFIIGFCPNLM